MAKTNTLKETHMIIVRSDGGVEYLFEDEANPINDLVLNLVSGGVPLHHLEVYRLVPKTAKVSVELT